MNIDYRSLKTTNHTDLPMENNKTYKVKLLDRFLTAKNINYLIIKINDDIFKIQESINKNFIAIWKAIELNEIFNLRKKTKTTFYMGKPKRVGRLYPTRIKQNKNTTTSTINEIQNLNNYFSKEQTAIENKVEIIGEIQNGIIKICREEQIKQCMFCGKTESLKFILKSQLFNEITEEEVAILCSKEKKGCGALGPFSKKKEQTIKLWNTRIT